MANFDISEWSKTIFNLGTLAKNDFIPSPFDDTDVYEPGKYMYSLRMAGEKLAKQFTENFYDIYTIDFNADENTLLGDNPAGVILHVIQSKYNQKYGEMPSDDIRKIQMYFILDLINSLSEDTFDNIRTLSARPGGEDGKYSIAIKWCFLDAYCYFKLEDTEREGDSETAEKIKEIRRSLAEEEQKLAKLDFLNNTAQEYMNANPDFFENEPEKTEKFVRTYCEYLPSHSHSNEEIKFNVHFTFISGVNYFPHFMYNGNGFVPVNLYNSAVRGVAQIGSQTNGIDLTRDFLLNIRDTAGRYMTLQLIEDPSAASFDREKLNWSVAFKNIESLAKQYGWIDPNEQAQKQKEQRKLEAQKREEQFRKWTAEGKCSACGGELKGFFGKKCSKCGKKA